MSEYSGRLATVNCSIVALACEAKPVQRLSSWSIALCVSQDAVAIAHVQLNRRWKFACEISLRGT